MAAGEQHHTVVVGIELGATFSGYAYSFDTEYDENPLKVGGHSWPVNDGQFNSYKIPTTILFDPERKFHSFGYHAEDKYVSLRLAGKHDKWLYFQRFIYHSKVLSEETILKAENGMEMPALDVFSAAILYLHQHVTSKIKYRLKGLKENRKCLVIISRDENDNDVFYNTAAHQAGIRWQIKSISKKTAFMNYFYQWIRCSRQSFRPGPKYLLLDATAQRVTIEVIAGGKDQSKYRCLFRHKYPGIGSEEINSEIIHYFEQMVGSNEIGSFNECLDEQLNLAREVEFQKRKSIGQKAKPFVLKLSKDKYKKLWKILSESKQVKKSGKCIDIQEGYIQLSTDFISGLSKDSADNLATGVYEVLRREDMLQLSDIIMVGGYSESPFLQKAIQRRFVHSNLHTLQEPGIVELKGAVIFGHSGGRLDRKQYISATAIKDYLNSNSIEKTEKVRNLRLMFVGPAKVGKSLLCKQLMQENPEPGQKQALEMYIQKYIVDLDTCEIENIAESEEDIAERRIKMHVVRQLSSAALKSENKGNKFAQTVLTADDPTTRNNTEQSHQPWMEQTSFEERKAYLSMWVFGRTSSISHTKHIFLSSDAVYLILFNIAECLESAESLPNLLEWVRSIGMYTLADERKHKISTPPIIFVGTHKDLITGTEAEVTQKIQLLKETMCDSEDLQAIKNHVYGFFEVNCTDSNDVGLKDLWKAILEVAPAQAQWEKELPLQWLLLEREMMKRKYSGCNTMTVDEVRNIGSKLDVDVDNTEQLKYFLRYLHFAGSILFFGDDHSSTGTSGSVIASTIILSPQWLVNAFQTILVESKHDNVHRNHNRHLEFLWMMYRKTAMLDMEFVEEVWKEKIGFDYITHKDIIIAFMERLALIAKPFSMNPSQSPNICYFVPSMLPQGQLEMPHELTHKYTVMTPTLCLVFRNRFVPQQILDQLMAAFIKTYELKKIDRKICLQRGFGIFKMDGLWSIIVCIQGMVKLTLYKQSPSKNIPAGVGLKTRLFVQDSLKKLNGLYQDKNLVFDYHLHCKVQYDEHHQTVPVREIESKGTLSCCDGEQKHFLMKRDLKPWFSEPKYQEKEEEDIDLPISSKILERKPTRRELSRIARCIGREYQLFFVELGLNIIDINQIEQELPAVSQATKYMHMFDRWACQNPERATNREIVKAMMRHDMNIVSLVDKNVFES